MTANPKVIKALRSLKKRGLLLPANVIEAARPVSSPLHDSFCWDNTKAAHGYRLWQARQLISVAVQYLPVNGEQRAVRVFQSLTTDRQKEDGGYRETVTILSNKNWRRQLLEDAIQELEVFQSKYAQLTELEAVFRASAKVRNQMLKLAA